MESLWNHHEITNSHRWAKQVTTALMSQDSPEATWARSPFLGDTGDGWTWPKIGSLQMSGIYWVYNIYIYMFLYLFNILYTFIYIKYIYTHIIIHFGFISTENVTVTVRYTDFMFSVSPSRWDDPNWLVLSQVMIKALQSAAFGVSLRCSNLTT